MGTLVHGLQSAAVTCIANEVNAKTVDASLRGLPDAGLNFLHDDVKPDMICSLRLPGHKAACMLFINQLQNIGKAAGVARLGFRIHVQGLKGTNAHQFAGSSLKGTISRGLEALRKDLHTMIALSVLEEDAVWLIFTLWLSCRQALQTWPVKLSFTGTTDVNHVMRQTLIRALKRRIKPSRNPDHDPAQ